MSFRFMRKDNTIRTIRNGEFIMAYMHIPREYLSRCGAELNSIPRCLKDLLYDERALAIVESDLFLEAIIDVYAYLVWPHMGYKESQMEIFSGDAPEWRYAHAAPMWIDGLEKLGVLPKLQNYIRYAFTVHLGYTSLATMQAVLSKAVPVIMRENHVQEIIACGREYRCFEDFDYRDSQQKKAFYRRWYHMRTQHPQISLEGYQEDYEAKHNGEAWDVPDEGAQTERSVLSQVNVEQFLKTLSEKDRQILELRMREYSLDEIAKKLGYQNHSGVLKRIKKIGLAYEAWSGKDLGF